MNRTLLALLLAGSVQAAVEPGNRPLPRTILAVYDSGQYKDVRDTRIHRLLEMPLNHLGLVVRYHDLESGLPALDQMRDVRGIVTWFRTDSMTNPVEFLQWEERAIDSGKRFVILGDLGVTKDQRGQPTPVSAINHFLAKIGFRIDNWTPVTYDQRVVYQNPAVIGFERPLPAILPSFDRVQIIDPRVHSHLTVRRGNDASTDAPLVVTGPHGGWVAKGFTHFANFSQDQLQWYINPFEFLRLAFAADEVPKLDTTTLSGRRIYYSQIDGDGWRNLTEVTRYLREKGSAARVILKEAIERFPDLPVTVGPIAGDLDPDWFGTQDSLGVAREMLSLPWVEAGSHTYSHPLDWESLYQNSAGGTHVQVQTRISEVTAFFDPARWTTLNRTLERYAQPAADEGKILKRGHSQLRSYTLFPFDPDQEIAGSIAFLNRLLPLGKRVELVQWSGTTMVPEVVLRAAQKAGVRNINGGDTRFDPEFNSYVWVAPLSRQVGTLRQIYSSASNENTYTNSWNERYFGFRYLRETLRNTESPVRVKPFDVYYHMYSGEKEPGIDAVVENLKYALSQELAPIAASQYAAIVDGFHSARIVELGQRRWRIDNRDSLDTVRFDRAESDWVDWAASSGVVGQRHFQGSLYVALDSADRAPVIALAAPGKLPAGTRPYLIQSRWMISKLCPTAAGFEFEAHGFGAGEMEWSAAPDAAYDVQVYRAAQLVETLHIVTNRDGKLRFTISQKAISPVGFRSFSRGERSEAISLRDSRPCAGERAGGKCPSHSQRRRSGTDVLPRARVRPGQAASGKATGCGRPVSRCDHAPG